MHRYALEHRVSHADVDLLGEVKVAAVLGLLEQAAVEASWDCGFDPGWYTAQGRVWIIRRTRLERVLPVGGGDRLRVETHVLDWRRARSLRSYEVRRADGPAAGAVVARATTDWVYCDLATGRPVSVTEDMRRGFSGEELVTLPRARALPEAGAGEPVAMPLVVRPSLLDHVTHVNNAAYAAMLEDGAFELFATLGWSAPRMLEHGGALRMRRARPRVPRRRGRRRRAGRAQLAACARTRTPGCGAGEVPDGVRLLQNIARTGGGRIMRAASDWVWRRRPAVLGGVPEA